MRMPIFARGLHADGVHLLHAASSNGQLGVSCMHMGNLAFVKMDRLLLGKKGAAALWEECRTSSIASCKRCLDVLLQMLLRSSHIGGMYEHSSIPMMLLQRTGSRLQPVPHLSETRKSDAVQVTVSTKVSRMSSTEKACASSATKMRATAAEALSSLGDSLDDIMSATCANLQPSVGTSRYPSDDQLKLCSVRTIILTFDE